MNFRSKSFKTGTLLRRREFSTLENQIGLTSNNKAQIRVDIISPKRFTPDYARQPQICGIWLVLCLSPTLEKRNIMLKFYGE